MNAAAALAPKGHGVHGTEVISRAEARAEPFTADQAVTVFARVVLKIKDRRTIPDFILAVQRLPQVVECHQMTDAGTFLLRVVATHLEEYRQFQLEQLIHIRGVASIKSEIPLQRVKPAQDPSRASPPENGGHLRAFFDATD